MHGSWDGIATNIWECDVNGSTEIETVALISPGNIINYWMFCNVINLNHSAEHFTW